MSFDSVKQLPFCITAILQGLRLYPANHPQITKQLESSIDTLKTFLQEHETLELGLVDGTLLINDIPCLDQTPALQELTRLFDRQQFQALEILPAIDSQQLLIFCQELPQLRGDDFVGRLEALGVTAIRAIIQEGQTEGAQATYKQALDAVENICHDIRLGRIPSSRNSIKSARGMVKTILAEPYTLLAMAMLKDYDNYTFQHSVNVSVIAMSVGKACGVSTTQLYELGLGGLLHDLGKMTIPPLIVNKPGRLDPAEVEVMQQHPVNGAKIVADMEQIPPVVIDIVNNHHLGYDHSGYPTDARSQTSSPLAEMTCIADTYDAMTTTRCYQPPCSPRQAIEQMERLSGKNLHPGYLQKFLTYLGPYPVGTLVRLKNGIIGLVCDQNQQQSGSLTLKVIIDVQGQRNMQPPVINLPDSSKIVAEVDPRLKGIRLDDYLP